MENFLIFQACKIRNNYFFCQNLANFVSPDLKLHNRYYHREKYSFLGKKRKISSDTLILKWLVAPMNFAINNLPLMTQFATFGETTICLLLLSLSSDLCSLTIFFLSTYFNLQPEDMVLKNDFIGIAIFFLSFVKKDIVILLVENERMRKTTKYNSM